MVNLLVSSTVVKLHYGIVLDWSLFVSDINLNLSISVLYFYFIYIFIFEPVSINIQPTDIHIQT